MNLRRIVAAGALASVAFLGSAHADTLVADGNWVGFTVDGNQAPYSLSWLDDNALPLHFTFTIAAGFQGRLTVVDTGFSGDRYSVTDHAGLLGQTGAGVDGDVNGAIEFSPDNALANPHFSRGVFTLGAGAHDISGVMSRSLADAYGPLNASIGAVRLEVSAVPEPATLATLLAGLSLLTVVLRRRGNPK